MSHIDINRKLPRAIAKEKDGIVLFWVEQLDIAGIHQRGLASLLRCNPKTIAQSVTVTQTPLLEAEALTPQGLRTITLVLESDIPKLLRYIARSKAKAETRDNADDLRDRLAQAGFKLMVMMEVVPDKLAQQAVNHAQEMALIKAKTDLAIAEKDLIEKRELVLALQPLHLADRTLGITTVKEIEVREKVICGDRLINDGSTINKTQLCRRYEFFTKTGKPDYTKLNAFLAANGVADNPDFWDEQMFVRSNKEFRREKISELDDIWHRTRSQLHLGEFLT